MNVKYLMTAGMLLSTFQSFATELATVDGQALGLSVSSYTYKEPSLNVKLDGYKLGLNYKTQMALQNHWFMALDSKIAYGPTDYSGSGTQENNSDWYLDVRPLFGKDFTIGESIFAPYSGLGYRQLKDDIRGYSSTGSSGYRRKSQYIYIPFGFNFRSDISDDAMLDTNVEVDYLVHGTQTSYLSDVGSSYSDLKNSQNEGYGARFSVMYTTSDFSIGPFLDYWNIAKSNTVTAGSISGYEPRNNTVEFGMKASMRF